MDPDAFVESLPSRWEDFPASELPLDARFAKILDEVPGLTKPNNLALLNHAASYLAQGESYVEVGSFRGTSLIAAMLDNKGDFVAIDNFSMSGGSRAS